MNRHRKNKERSRSRSCKSRLSPIIQGILMKHISVWYCSSCGHKQARWVGQCPSCTEWNTLQEEVESSAKNIKHVLSPAARMRQMLPVRLTEITTGTTARCLTGLGELDRCLGVGLVSGSLTLIGGEPGIGKS